jgi:hypothetical protein
MEVSWLALEFKKNWKERVKYAPERFYFSGARGQKIIYRLMLKHLLLEKNQLLNELNLTGRILATCIFWSMIVPFLFLRLKENYASIFHALGPPPPHKRKKRNYVVDSTAGINQSNTAVWAVLKQPCLTGGQTGTIQPKHQPTGWTDFFNQFLAGLVQPVTGTDWTGLFNPLAGALVRQCLSNRCLNSRVWLVNSGSLGVRSVCSQECCLFFKKV